MKTIVPIILLLASIGLFVFFTNKEYQAIKTIRAEISEYDKALGRSKDILKKRAELQAKYAEFSNGDLRSLEKLLPNHVDNVQLVLDINGIARRHSMSVSRVKVAEEETRDVQIGPDLKPYASILVSFRTVGSYANFQGFIRDLEQALRLTDITSLSFKATPQNVNEYTMTIRTYWLK